MIWPIFAVIAIVALGLGCVWLYRNRARTGWQIGPIIRGKNYSTGYPDKAERDGSFDFIPGTAHIDYLTKPCGSLRLGAVLHIEVEITGNTAFTGKAEEGSTFGGFARLVPYFACNGDDWTTPELRWWAGSHRIEPLVPGVHTFTVPLDLAHWSDVYGKRDQQAFYHALANADRIGLTFGNASSFGHGVHSSKPARFHVRRFEVVG